YPVFEAKGLKRAACLLAHLILNGEFLVGHFKAWVLVVFKLGLPGAGPRRRSCASTWDAAPCYRWSDRVSASPSSPQPHRCYPRPILRFCRSQTNRSLSRSQPSDRRSIAAPHFTTCWHSQTTWGVLSLHPRSEEHTSELQSRENLVCRPLLENKNDSTQRTNTLT